MIAITSSAGRWLAPFLFFMFAASAYSSQHKVLVVMSYEEDNPWCEEIREGIDGVLAGNSDITYFYMDTKVRFTGGEARAAAAYELYRQLEPDGVITVDDNAQWMFVLPYLHGKVKTPVMFCGVNAEAEKYGFPSEHVSGSLERGHIRESIAFMKQLKPDLGSVCFLVKDSPSGTALKRQVDGEQADYLAAVGGFFAVSTTADIEALGPRLGADCDAVYLDSLEGIVDAAGVALDHARVFAALGAVFTGPTIGANRYHVEQGALCAVVKTGQEQGGAAAELLLRAMQGTPVSELPVTRNYRGRRIINVTAMERLGIRPRPIVLRGATLVRTPE
jgi:ABC-type uncharacterized transport system substrate-binding protein